MKRTAASLLLPPYALKVGILRRLDAAAVFPGLFRLLELRLRAEQCYIARYELSCPPGIKTCDVRFPAQQALRQTRRSIQPCDHVSERVVEAKTAHKVATCDEGNWPYAAVLSSGKP